MKLSVIIPVYNGEKHINNCIAFLKNEKFRDVEFIIINDGSTDLTEQIVLKSICNDNRFKLVNKKNSGVSDSRNNGIKLCSGEYIMFLDCDDIYESGFLDYINKILINNKIEVLLFGFSIVGSKNRYNDTNILKQMNGRFVESTNILKKIFNPKNTIYGYAWRACYSKQLILKNSIYFPSNIRISEDYMFFCETIYYSNYTYVDSIELYKYNINDTSVTKKYIPTLLSDMEYVNRNLYEKIIKNNEELKDIFAYSEINTFLRFTQNELRSNKKFKEKIRKIRETRKKYITLMSENNLKFGFSRKSYLQLLLLKKNLIILYSLLFYTKNILCGD